MIEQKKWISEAIKKIKADYNRSSDTHLIKLDLPFFKNIDKFSLKNLIIKHKNYINEPSSC